MCYLFDDKYNYTLLPFCLKQVSAFLNFTVKDIVVIMRLLKSSNRFVAMYFPLNYRFIFTMKNTLYMILISVVLIGVIHSPFFIGKFLKSWIYKEYTKPRKISHSETENFQRTIKTEDLYDLTQFLIDCPLRKGFLLTCMDIGIDIGINI